VDFGVKVGVTVAEQKRTVTVGLIVDMKTLKLLPLIVFI
jgi:hypothetical protein